MAVIERILTACNSHDIPCGMHVVMPDAAMLQMRIDQGYRFIAYSIDAVFLDSAAAAPETRMR